MHCVDSLPGWRTSGTCFCSQTVDSRMIGMKETGWGDSKDSSKEFPVIGVDIPAAATQVEIRQEQR